MAIQFRCTSCRCLLATKDRHPGDSIRCPGCGSNQAVPAAGAVASAPAPAIKTTPAARRGPAAPPAPASYDDAPSGGGSGGSLAVAGGLIAAVVAVVGIGGGFLLFRSASRPVGVTPPVAVAVAPVDRDDRPAEPVAGENPAELPATLPIIKINDEKKPEPSAPTVKPPVEDPKPVATVAVRRPLDKVVVKKRVESREDDLIKQIAHARELALDKTPARQESAAMVIAASNAARTGGTKDTTLALLDGRKDLAGLPLRRGDDCKLTPGAADHMGTGSLALRAMMSTAAATGAVRSRFSGGTAAATPPDPDAFQRTLTADASRRSKWNRAEGIPTLMQMLMAEGEGMREVLVEQIAGIPGREASEALANRALFDTHPVVREKALKALNARPVGEFRDILLAGFTYPWPAVAEHAAEAMVALELKEAVPQLLTLLDMPDPRAPYDGPKGGKFVKELVKINHLSNCLMCHAPSQREDDKVRGFVPPTNRALPPAFSNAYYAPKQEGIFVRADITYVKQDFSVPLPVKNPGLWPTVQRFDFLTRERPATAADLKGVTRDDLGEKKALLFTLRELTGKDPGPTVSDWKKLFERKLEVRKLEGAFTSANALAAAGDNVYVRDMGRVLLRGADGKFAEWRRDDGDVGSMTIDAKGRLVAVRRKTGDVVALTKTESTRLAGKDGLAGYAGLGRAAADPAGGIYFVEEADDGCSLHYRSVGGNVRKMPFSLGRIRGVAVAPDGKSLYVASASGELTGVALESAGAPGKMSVINRLASAAGESSPGTAVDAVTDGRGLICVANGSTKAVEVFSKLGTRLGYAALPETPTALAVGGKSRTTLYVLTRNALFAVDLADADPAAVLADAR